MILAFLFAAAAVLGLSLLTLIQTKGLEHVIIHYRWIFVCVFLLPASAVYDVFYYVRNKLIFKFRSAPKQHGVRVQEVQEQVQLINALLTTKLF